MAFIQTQIEYVGYHKNLYLLTRNKEIIINSIQESYQLNLRKSGLIQKNVNDFDEV